MHELNLPRPLWQRILDTIGSEPVESGGVFALEGNNTVARYYFDIHAGSGSRFYRPSAHRLTAQVNQWLQSPDISFGGFIHSHPPGNTSLSPMDMVAAEMTMAANQMPRMYMLILCQGELLGYCLTSEQPEGPAAVQPCFIRITD